MKFPRTLQLAVQQRVTRLLFAWLVVVQFPLPVVHAHEGEGEELQLIEHIGRHHSEHGGGTSDATDCLHVHFFMPWDFGTSPDGEPSQSEPASQPLGAWAGQLRDASLPELLAEFSPGSVPPAELCWMDVTTIAGIGNGVPSQIVAAPFHNVSVHTRLGIYRC